MMINLDNYETYFLLYIDDELSKEQCAAVEAFVMQYPQLAAELNMLRETKLPLADAVVFSNKTSLYKTSGTSINISNYEAYFLLHTDKELSATQEEEVEHFVLQHPQLQEEFLLLQKAKLVPEIISYPDKQELYKLADKRIIPLYFTRIAVAAAIAGIVVIAGSLFVNSNHHPQVAISAKQADVNAKSTLLKKDSIVTVPEKKDDNVVIIKNQTKQIDKTPLSSGKSVIAKVPAAKDNKKNTARLVVVQHDSLPAAQQTAPAPEQNAMAANNTTPTQTKTAALKLLDNSDEKEPEPSSVMYVSNDYAIARPAAYKELNTDEDDQTLYVGSLQLNKAKVNGLLKKASHLLGSRGKENNLRE